MKLICSLFMMLVLRQACAAVVKKQPAFSEPVYSDSYVPAAIQVIFHAVEQLKIAREEEAMLNNTRASLSTTTRMTPSSTSTSSSIEGEQVTLQETTAAPETMIEPVLQGQEEMHGAKEEEAKKQTESSKDDQTSFDQSTQAEYASGQSTPSELSAEVTQAAYEESPEINEETPESNYATPETNYEMPELVYGAQETNQEIPEENQENDTTTETSPVKLTLDAPKKKVPTVDSIVEEIYEIVKPTSSAPSDENPENSDEAKSASGMAIEKMESIEEEEEETRFTLLGEKVAQVPRPSLSSYLRRAKVPPSATLQQLGGLYDALSKDARKQGFGKYTGYSDDVLKTLETSAEGGIAPQLQKILQKVAEKNELTRSDARLKTTDALKDLDNPSSDLSKDLRPLLPLRFAP